MGIHLKNIRCLRHLLIQTHHRDLIMSMRLPEKCCIIICVNMFSNSKEHFNVQANTGPFPFWPNAQIPLLLICIIFTFWREYRMPPISPDFIQLITASKSLLAGYGLATPGFSLEDMSKIIYDPMWIHPALYGIAMALLLQFSPNTSHIFLIPNLFFSLIFYISWFFIFKLIGSAITDKSKLLFWVIWAFMVDPLYKLYPSGIMAISLFSIGFAFSMQAIKSKNPSILLLVLTGLPWGMCIAIRFFYWPLIAIMPLIILLVGFNWKTNHIKFGVGLFLIIGICWYSSYFLNQSLSGGGSVIGRHHSGLFWHQLLEYYPFPCDSIGFYETWKSFTSNPEIFTIGIIAATGLVSFVFVYEGVSTTISFLTRSDEKKFRPYIFLKITGISMVTLTFLMTVYLTIHYKFPVVCGSESRYFALTGPFILLFLSDFLFKKQLKSKWKKPISILLVILFLTSSFQIYLRPRNIFLKNSYFGENWYSKMEIMTTRLEQLFGSVKSESPVIFLDGPWEYTYHRLMYARYMGIPSHFVYPDQFNPKTSELVTLLFSIPKNPEDLGHELLHDFASNVQAIKIGESGPVVIMKATITPNI